MCNHSKNPIDTRHRKGDRLEDGRAHQEDHARWNRRDFLFRVGAASAGMTLAIDGFRMKAFAGGGLLNRLKALETDRVLVLIQLKGGNDGLNTVIPFRDSNYYDARPTIAIPQTQSIQLDYQTGLHSSLADIIPLWHDGQLGILRNVGYPSPNLSHFKSTDYWMSGAGSPELLNTGWAGRGLYAAYPDLEEEPLDYPLAVQIGTASSLLFQSEVGEMGMTIRDVDLFHRIVQGSEIWDTSNLPDTTFGTELGFVRQIANDSITYADALQKANGATENEARYPNTTFGESLSVVARLIKGGLGSKIYTITLSGFDTHSNQESRQSALFEQVAGSLKAFYEDLAAGSAAEKVLAVTFSEFGRRVSENASQGTDHGTSAPMFVAGPGVKPGLLGLAPNLDSGALDGTGNPMYEMDFRAVYATLLVDWFGMNPIEVAEVMGAQFETLGFIEDPISTDTNNEVPSGFDLAQNYPNPFNPSTRISFSLENQSNVRLTVYDTQGRSVGTLLDGPMTAGQHQLTFDASHLPSGMYMYRLDTPSGYTTRKMTLIR